MKQSTPEVKQPTKTPYQAPRIETVLTAKDIERELFYAGGGPSTPL